MTYSRKKIIWLGLGFCKLQWPFEEGQYPPSLHSTQFILVQRQVSPLPPSDSTLGLCQSPHGGHVGEDKTVFIQISGRTLSPEIFKATCLNRKFNPHVSDSYVYLMHQNIIPLKSKWPFYRLLPQEWKVVLGQELANSNSPKSKFLSKFPTWNIEPGFEIRPPSPQPPQGDCKSWDTSFHHTLSILIIYIHGGFQWKPIKSYLSANYHNDAVRESRWRKGYTSPHSRTWEGKSSDWPGVTERLGASQQCRLNCRPRVGSQTFPGNPNGKASQLEDLDPELPQFCS